MRRCRLRALLLGAARRTRQAIVWWEHFSISRVSRISRRNIMKKSTWQWLSGAGLGTAVGVGLVAIGLSPWIVAAVGVGAAFGINKLELE